MGIRALLRLHPPCKCKLFHTRHGIQFVVEHPSDGGKKGRPSSMVSPPSPSRTIMPSAYSSSCSWHCGSAWLSVCLAANVARQVWAMAGCCRCPFKNECGAQRCVAFMAAQKQPPPARSDAASEEEAPLMTKASTHVVAEAIQPKRRGLALAARRARGDRSWTCDASVTHSRCKFGSCLRSRGQLG
jgi:hypothetical protein